MKTVSDYNATKKFVYETRESRLKKCVKIIASLPPGRMLDIGCSSGDWATYWQSANWQCAGVDIDREHIKIARERGIDARYCDLNQSPLPFESEGFDLIFAGEVIEHLIDTDGFLSELHRCVRPGGAVLLTTPNLASFENRMRILLGIYPIWVNYNLSGAGHVRAYTPGVLKNQLEKHGFRVVVQKGNWVPFMPQHVIDDVRMPLLAFTGDMFPSLAMAIIMLARRED